MYRLLSWFILIIFFVILLVPLSYQAAINYERREDKRCLNLLGMEIVNFLSDEMEFDPEACMKSLIALDKTKNFAGMIIINNEVIKGIRSDLSYTKVYDIEENSQVPRRTYVNRILNEILRQELELSKIEIALSSREKAFFNDLDDNITIFLISSNNSFINAAGFKLIF